MKYTVNEIKDNRAIVTYEDGSWAKIELFEGITEEQFDALVQQFAPTIITGDVDSSFIEVGKEKDVIEIEQDESVAKIEESPELPEWLLNRISAYGTLASQIEFITEKGITAWKSHVEEIKKQFPKEE